MPVALHNRDSAAATSTMSRRRLHEGYMPATRIFRTTLNSLPVRTRSAWNYRCGRAYHVMGFGCSHRLPGVLPSLPHARDQEEVAR